MIVCLQLIKAANYFRLGPVSKAYRAVDRHARKRLRQWLCAKHKVSWLATGKFSEASMHDTFGLVRLTGRMRSFSESLCCGERAARDILCPGVVVADAIPQSVQDSDNGAVFRDPSEFADQIRHLLRVDAVMMTGLVLAHRKFGVRASGPVQFEADRRRVDGGIGHNLLQDGPQEALFQQTG